MPCRTEAKPRSTSTRMPGSRPSFSATRSDRTCLERRSPCLIAVGGLSGSGKSTIARLAAPDIGAVPGALGEPATVVEQLCEFTSAAAG